MESEKCCEIRKGRDMTGCSEIKSEEIAKHDTNFIHALSAFHDHFVWLAKRSARGFLCGTVCELQLHERSEKNILKIA